MVARDEEHEAAGRLAGLFSECPANMQGKSHVWNVDNGACQKCGARFPYSDGEQIRTAGKVAEDTK